MIVSDKLFMMCFGYRPYKRIFLEALETEERAIRRNNDLIFIIRLMG